jgi:hypothetical protein
MLLEGVIVSSLQTRRVKKTAPGEGIDEDARNCVCVAVLVERWFGVTVWAEFGRSLYFCVSNRLIVR